MRTHRDGTIPLADGPGAAAVPEAGPPYYLVRVSGLYLNAAGWLVGDPAKAQVFGDKAAARKRADEVQDKKLWSGKVAVVRRMHLTARQW